MANRPNSRGARSAAQEKKSHRAGDGDTELLTALTWDMVSINKHLEDIRRICAEVLGISGTQWLILMAIKELDSGNGASVSEVSAKTHVHPNFVTLQTKILEQSGFLVRSNSASDGRVVLMSLTGKARTDIARLSVLRSRLNSSVSANMSPRTLKEIVDTLALIKRSVAMAVLQLDVDRKQFLESTGDTSGARTQTNRSAARAATAPRLTRPRQE